jgi:hypothetical protein
LETGFIAYLSRKFISRKISELPVRQSDDFSDCSGKVWMGGILGINNRKPGAADS